MTRGTVLIADDESYVTAVVGLKLREAGFEVIVANNGDEAYQIACAQTLSMIITDYQMPILTGFELGKLLKSNPRTAGIPVIMLTARGHRIAPSEMSQTSIRHLMAKPFSARELVHKVEEMTGTDTANGAPRPATASLEVNAA